MDASSAVLVEKSTQEKVFFRPWREITLISMILMELSWVTLWFLLITPSGQAVLYLQAILVLMGMLALVYLLNRLMVFIGARSLIHRAVLLLALVVNLFIGLKMLLYTREAISLGEILNRPLSTFQDMSEIVPVEFVVMVFVLLVCWRGIVYSDHQVGSVNALYSFRMGIVMFILYGFILPFYGGSPFPALYIFLFFSLLAMTTARISVLSQLRGGQKVRFSRHWIAGITLVIIGMVGLSALVVSFSQELLFNLLSMLFSWLVYLVVLLFSPLVFLFLQFFIWLFGSIRIGEIFEVFTQLMKNLETLLNGMMNTMSSWLSQFNLDRAAAFFEYLARLKPLYLWGILGLLVAAILLGLRRYIFRGDSLDGAEMQAEPIDEDLLQLLRSTLGRGLDKLADNLDDILRLRRARRLLAAARIRRIYAMLLGLNARLDNPRPASRTPLEFLPQMEQLFPALSNELTIITDTYLLVRYGGIPESAEDLVRVETAWRRVSSAGKERLKARRRSRRI